MENINLDKIDEIITYTSLIIGLIMWVMGVALLVKMIYE